MPKHLRLGFIGSGGICNNHVNAMDGLPDVSFAAFCDVKKAQAKAMADRFGAEAFTSPEKMLAAMDLDAVWVLLPPFAHGEAEMACIQHQVPFLVEKPVHLDPKAAAKIAAAVEKAGLLAVAGYMNRYRKSIAVARKALQADPAIYAWGGWLGGHMTDPNHWWIRKDLSGGQFTEQVTHTVDLARYLMGDAVSVSAFAAQGFVKMKNYTIDDALAVSVKFASGAVANLCSCCAARARGGIALDLYGYSTTVKLSNWAHDAEIYELDKKKPRVISGEESVPVFALEDRAFLKAVRTGKADGIMSAYADGVKSLALSAAANESAEKGGKPIALK